MKPGTFGRDGSSLAKVRRAGGTDVALAAMLAAAVYGVVALARAWAAPLLPVVSIDLSLAALPGYALRSLSRGLAAYVLSLLFTLTYGSWAAKDRVAEGSWC